VRAGIAAQRETRRVPCAAGPLSKFDYATFNNGYDEFAVNAEKFTLEEAIKIFEEEREPNMVGKEIGQFIVSRAFVKWRAGINEDKEACVG
jgi:hypothetical protein